MKKFALFCGIALSLGLAACDDQLPNPPAQQYPQPEIFDAAGLVLTQADYGVTSPLNLNSYAEKGELVPVLNIASITNFPEDYTLSVKMQVGSDADFTSTATVNATIADNVVYVTPSGLTDGIREVITKDPSQLTINARFQAYAVNGASTMLLGGPDHYYYTGEYVVVPYQSYVIDNEYYLVGSFCNWDLNKGLKFTHGDPSESVYDVPSFSLKFDVTAEQAAAGFLYKVVPASAVAAGNFAGSFGFAPEYILDEETKETVEQNYGSLVLTDAAEAEAGVINQEGPYMLKIDVDAKTYELQIALDYLWAPGNGSSNYDFTKVQQLATTNYINYQGVAHLRNQWWLTGQASTEGINYKTAEGTTETVSGLVTSGSIQSYSGDNGTKMQISENGLYWLDVNLVRLTYKATLLQRVSIVGSFNGWNADEAIDLKTDNKFLVWTGVVDLDGEFKINTNGAWDIDFGSNTAEIGTPNKLDYKGANINVPAGKYEVKVDFSALPYTITLTKK